MQTRFAPDRQWKRETLADQKRDHLPGTMSAAATPKMETGHRADENRARHPWCTPHTSAGG